MGMLLHRGRKRPAEKAQRAVTPAPAPKAESSTGTDAKPVVRPTVKKRTK